MISSTNLGGGSVRGNVEKWMPEFLEAMLSQLSTFGHFITELFYAVADYETMGLLGAKTNMKKTACDRQQVTPTYYAALGLLQGDGYSTELMNSR